MPSRRLSAARGTDGTIIFGTVGNGIMQVPAGGVPALLTTTRAQRSPHISVFPSGRATFLYLEHPGIGIYLGSLDVKPEQQSSRRILNITDGGLCGVRGLRMVACSSYATVHC
jgi:hypothetical protein